MIVSFVKKWSALGFVVLFALILSGCNLIPEEEQVLAPPVKDAPKVVYDLVEVKKGNIVKKIVDTANLVSVTQSDLSFKNQTGHLKAIYVKTGDAVKAGDLLAELESNDMANQIAIQQINVNKAQLALEKYKQDQQNELDLANQQLDDLTKKLNESLALGDAVAKSDLADLKNQVERKKNSIAALINDQKLTLAMNEQDVEISRQSLQNLKDQLLKLQIYSPINGTIDYVNTKYRLGEMVDAFMTMIRVANQNDLQVMYSDQFVGSFVLGMKVDVTLDDKKYSGVVVMDPSNVPVDANDELKRSIMIKVADLPNTARIGDKVTLEVVLDKKDNVIVLDKNLVHSIGSRNFVRVLENGIKKEQDIELGITAATEVEVLKGLEVGEKIIK